VKICADFYNKAEIIQARNMIDDATGTRLPKRNRSADKLRLTVEDNVKCVLDPGIKLPPFYAKNIAHLPLVDATHCDISAILLFVQKSVIWDRCIH